jgi:hypothetical protein
MGLSNQRGKDSKGSKGLKGSKQFAMGMNDLLCWLASPMNMKETIDALCVSIDPT